MFPKYTKIMRLLLLTCIVVESCLSSSPVLTHNTARPNDILKKDFSPFNFLWMDSELNRYFGDIKNDFGISSNGYWRVVPESLPPKKIADKESTSMSLTPPRAHLPWILLPPEPEKDQETSSDKILTEISTISSITNFTPTRSDEVEQTTNNDSEESEANTFDVHPEVVEKSDDECGKRNVEIVVALPSDNNFQNYYTFYTGPLGRPPIKYTDDKIYMHMTEDNFVKLMKELGPLISKPLQYII